MHQKAIDRYSEIDSPVSRFDPRAKAVCVLAFVLCVAITPQTTPFPFLLYAAILAAAAALARIPAGFILTRSLVIFPFVFMIGLLNLFFKPIDVFLWLLVRSWLSILAIILMTATTEMTSLFKALESLGLPAILTSVLSFMYRYIFVLIDRVSVMDRARMARSYGRRGLRQMRAMGGMLGSLFISTYERGERIHLAMQARGYHGHSHIIRPFRLTATDVTATVVFLVLLLLTLTAALVMVRVTM
jgi:cobalt/nickel transport system permease protein